jgi:hypothetical protein
MNTLEIENILRSDCKLSTKFEGVFASDRLPLFCDSETALVMNLDPHNQGGSHWICMYIENGKGEYIDSYGLSPLVHSSISNNYHNNCIDFLNRNCVSWKCNVMQLQSIDTQVCGHYCIWYLSERARGKSMKEITDQFTRNYAKNDVIVKELVEERYGKIVKKVVAVVAVEEKRRRECVQCCCAMKRCEIFSN